MPDSSDNVNARDGASIVWGPEIRVDGKRPEWLADGVQCRALDPFGRWYGGGDGVNQEAEDWSWGSIQAIRLPANHPHYSKAPTIPELDPALWDRMVAYIREDVKHWPDGMNAEVGRGILADLPKPVDPDLIEARGIVANATPHVGEYCGQDILAGLEDGCFAMQVALAAIKRGRELAAPEVSHVG